MKKKKREREKYYLNWNWLPLKTAQPAMFHNYVSSKELST